MRRLRALRRKPAYVLRAARLLSMEPGRPVLEDAAVAVVDDRIVEVGSWPGLRGRHRGPVEDLGQVALLPGLVNAHTHLELSHLSPPPFRGRGFPAWVRWLMDQPLYDVTGQDVARALDDLESCGTAAVADVATRVAPLVARALDQADMGGVVQHEVIGYAPWSLPQDVAPARLSLAGHALYSTSPENLRAAKAWDLAHGRAFSLHLSEHEAELEVLATGQGEFALALKRGLIPKDFRPPGRTPTAWADSLGLLDQRTLAVHAVHLTPGDVAALARSGATVCLCPRSNALIGSGRADPAALLAAGVPLCLGTDSTASVETLNLFDELRFFLETFPGTCSPVDTLAMVTRTPARALGLSDYGTVRAGSKARFSMLPADLEIALDD
ncbi:amidohydrolase family protein [Fundidesulfovibrio butyratiphilus]